MSHQDDPENQPTDERYENILRNTLLKRTGRSFKRNVDAARLPQQEKVKHEDVAERIFDNILKRKQERSQTPQDPEPDLPTSADERPSEISKTYGEILDDILWPGMDESGGDSDFSAQLTLAEANPMPARPDAFAPLPEDLREDPDAGNPYQSILRRTLETRQATFSRRGRGALRVEAVESEPDDGISQPSSHHYSAALDEILGFEEEEPPGFREEPSLSRTMYHQKLDEILWPSEDERPQAKDLPPVDEGKLRSVVADYLRQLILPEPYGLIGVQRRVLDDKYALYWIRETMHDLAQTLQTLETDFTVWIFLQHIDLLKKVINYDFIDRYRMMIEQMLPAQKPVSPFNQRKKEQSLFEKMNSGKFDDARRLLKAGRDSYTDEEILTLYNFFKARLPEFLKQHQATLRLVLAARNEQAGGNPFVASFLAALFFSEPFERQFRALHENEDRYKQAWQNFLRDRCEIMAKHNDPLVPTILVAMDLFHEKASFFRPAERETLAQSLELLEALMRYLTDDYFNKEDLLKDFQALTDTRVQAQFHVEGQSLTALGQEIGALAAQADSSARIRANHLNAIYERHTQAMSDAYHKRRDTLDKLSANKGPGTGSRKSFVQRKLKACQQYLQRAPKRSLQPVEIPYREYSPEFLEVRQRELSETMFWDNDYEKQILGLAFEKANMVLKSLNNSKSTAKFNLKVLFDGEPTQERFLQALHQLGAQLQQLLAAYPNHESLHYAHAVLHRYLVGLRAPDAQIEETFYSNAARIGYIAAYLAHVSHLKLLVNLQFQQVIYDFHTLFELVHALYLIEAVAVQPASGFGDHYREMLIPSWYCLLQHCLMVGTGQYHFVANPLALHDYSWAPPLSFALDAFGDDEDEDFATLSMDAGDEERDEHGDLVRFPALARGRRPATESAGPPAGRSRFGRKPIAEPEDDYDSDESQDEDDLPALPAKPSRRLLPSAPPGKFEMYQAPTRRQMQPVNQIDDDDFYKVIGQTQANPPEAPAARGPQDPPAFTRPRSLAEDDEPPAFTRPRGIMDEDPPAFPRSRAAEDPPAFTRSRAAAEDPPAFTRPRGLTQDEPPARAASRRPVTEVSAADRKAAARADAADKSKDGPGRNKRWLEITPVPQDRKDYDQMLDAILEGWGPDEPEDAAPAPRTLSRRASRPPSAVPETQVPPDEDSLSIVDQILRRNALDPNMDVSGDTSISHTIRRKLDDDY